MEEIPELKVEEYYHARKVMHLAKEFLLKTLNIIEQYFHWLNHIIDKNVFLIYYIRLLFLSLNKYFPYSK